MFSPTFLHAKLSHCECSIALSLAAKTKMLTFTAVTLLALLQSATAATNVTSRTAPVGAEVLTVAVIGGSCSTIHASLDIDGN